MAVFGDDYIYSRLFVATPELYMNVTYVDVLMAHGLLSESDFALVNRIRKGHRTAQKLRGKSLIERLMIVAPELMSVTTINYLRKYNLVSISEAHALRTALRAANVLIPFDVSHTTITQRLVVLMNEVLSVETVNFIRALDQARIDDEAAVLRGIKSRLSSEDAEKFAEMVARSISRANMMRDVIGTAKALSMAIKEASIYNSRWDAITVVGEGIFNEAMLRRAVRLGIISQSRYDITLALMELGMNSWRKALVISAQENWHARALLISEGILSFEMVNALRAAGLIDDELARLMYPAVNAIQQMTRNKLAQHMKSTRVRALPGETAIQAYARVTAANDAALLRLLADAARDARNEARRLAKQKGFSALRKSEQQRLIERNLHLQMKALYENVGHLTIFGEKEAARAALTAMDNLQSKVFSKKNEALRRSLLRSAEAGVDSYVSRQSSMRTLSGRVYKNYNFNKDRISKEINKSLLRSQNANDLSRAIFRFIDPKTPGGASYGAMRLARTEINNAFHETSIRYTIDMPWVTGYKWNLSKSHGHLDICNTMSSANHDGIGKGVYKKGNVPGKPHPHCFCYVTTMSAKNSDFERQLKAGRYDAYFKNRGPAPMTQGISDYGDLAPRPGGYQAMLNGAGNIALGIAVELIIASV